MAGLLAAGAAVLALCVGCGGGVGATSDTGTATSGSASDLGSQLDQLQATLNSVSAQVDADSTP